MNGRGIEQRSNRGPQRLLVENVGLIAADLEGFDYVDEPIGSTITIRYFPMTWNTGG